MFHKLAQCVCVMALLGLFMAASAFAGATIRYSDHDSPGGMRTQFLEKVWIPEIEKQSRGDVQMQPLFGGALLEAAEALGGVADGVADAAFVFPDFYPKQLLLHQVFKLFPVGPQTWASQQWFYTQVYNTIPEFSAELAKFNMKPLLITSGLPGSFNTTNEIKTIDALVGKKWRASSRWHLAYFKSFGAVPVSVPWGDCYMALQTGVVDGVFANYDGAHLTKLDEAGKHVMVSKALWWATPFLHVINLDKWNSLSKDQQAAVNRATDIAYEKFSDIYNNAFQEIWDTQKKDGIDVRLMAPEDLAKWESRSGYKDQQKVWVTEVKEAGYTDAEAILAKLQKLVDEARAREK